jgi:hypothetical protein
LLRFVFVALTLGVVAGCGESDPVVPYADQADVRGLRVSAEATGIAMVNQSDRTIYSFTIEEGMLPLYDGVPCTVCNPVKAGETVLVPWSTVYGYTPAKLRYHVTWWQVGTAPDGSQVAMYPQRVTISR